MPNMPPKPRGPILESTAKRPRAQGPVHYKHQHATRVQAQAGEFECTLTDRDETADSALIAITGLRDEE